MDKDRLIAAAGQVYAAAAPVSESEGCTGVVVLVFDETGAFQLRTGSDVNVTVLAGLFARAMVACACVPSPPFTVELREK